MAHLSLSQPRLLLSYSPHILCQITGCHRRLHFLSAHLHRVVSKLVVATNHRICRNDIYIEIQYFTCPLLAESYDSPLSRLQITETSCQRQHRSCAEMHVYYFIALVCSLKNHERPTLLRCSTTFIAIQGTHLSLIYPIVNCPNIAHPWFTRSCLSNRRFVVCLTECLFESISRKSPRAVSVLI